MKEELKGLAIEIGNQDDDPEGCIVTVRVDRKLVRDIKQNMVYQPVVLTFGED